jgi:large subunit ribosomal protein L4
MSEQIDIVNQKGELINNFQLNSFFREIPLSHWNISLVNRYYLANGRQGTKKTKSKGEVSGGGRKPWRQKGTGRARQGSIRAPQFRGGGTTFGPRGEENYSLDINKKVKKKVFQTLLGEKIRQKKIVVIDKIMLAIPKTKEAVKILDALPMKNGKKLIILGKDEDNKKTIIRAFRNLPGLEIIESHILNARQVISFTYLVFTYLAFTEIEKRLI